MKNAVKNPIDIIMGSSIMLDRVHDDKLENTVLYRYLMLSDFCLEVLLKIHIRNNNS